MSVRPSEETRATSDDRSTPTKVALDTVELAVEVVVVTPVVWLLGNTIGWLGDI